MERKLTNIYLMGELAELFGKEWRLAVTSPAEAIRAIDINTKGKLSKYFFKEGAQKYYKVCLQDEDKSIGVNELTHKSGHCDIYIVPTVAGQNSGAAKIIIGAVLVIATIVAIIVFPPAAGSLLFYADGVALGIGTSLIMGGIAQLLAPHQNQDQNDQINSDSFAGSIGSVQQGIAVPIAYGKCLASPSTISVWFNCVDYDTSVGNFVGAVELAGIPGGGTEFTPSSSNPVVGGAGGG